MRRTDGARPETWRSPDDAKCSNCGRIHNRQTCPAQDETWPQLREAEPLRRNVPIDSSNSKCSCTTEETSTTSACNQRCRLRYVGPRVYNRMPVSQCEYSPFYTTLHVGCDSVPMKFKVDTGAQINLIPITAFDTLAESRMKQLKPTQVRLTGYSGNVVPTTGTCRIECKLRDKPHTLDFFYR